MVFIVSALIISVLGLLPGNKVEAASTGWQTTNGVTAILYTDRSGSYPASDSFVGVTAEKTAAGGTVYYTMDLHQYINGTWYSLGNDQQSGSFSSASPLKKFNIDNHLSKGKSGTFRVVMELNSNNDWSNPNSFRGFFTTPSFTISN